MLELQFSVGPTPRKGKHVIRVNQLAPLEGQNPAALPDVGGVEYQVTIH